MTKPVLAQESERGSSHRAPADAASDWQKWMRSSCSAVVNACLVAIERTAHRF